MVTLPTWLADSALKRRLMIGTGLLLALLLGALIWLIEPASDDAPVGTLLPWMLAGLLLLALTAGYGLHRRIMTRDGRLRARLGHHEAAEAMAGLGLWSLEPISGAMTYSRGALRVLGLDTTSSGPDLEDFLARVHPADRDRWAGIHQDAVESVGQARIEYRVGLDDGSERWIRSIARAVRMRADAQDIRLQGTIQDISGMRAMQRELAASEAKFRELTQLGSDWVWETGDDHRLTYLSESAEAVLGPWVKAWTGHTLWEYANEDPLRSDWASLRALHEAHDAYDAFECSRLDDDGNLVVLSLNARPITDESGAFAGHRGTGREITREWQQRTLLEIAGDVAAIMREQSDPQRVISAVIITISGRLSWLGGVHLVREDGGARAREHWGTAAFSQVVKGLDALMAIDDVTVEARAFRDGKAIWLQRAELEKEFARRWRIREVGATAAFIAPIVDEENRGDECAAVSRTGRFPGR